jgi:hypothetical protein
MWARRQFRRNGAPTSRDKGVSAFLHIQDSAYGFLTVDAALP